METKLQIDCTGCDAPCCRALVLNLRPQESMRELLKAHYGRDIDLVTVTLNHTCEKLVDNRCTIYEERPQQCRDFICHPSDRPNVLKLEISTKP
jgi:Fe-S-cluster containining protein